MKIVGILTVSQSDWRHVYSSILNFANEDIDFLFLKSQEIYAALKEDKEKSLSDFINSSYNNFQADVIVGALTKQGTDKIYTPKKKYFKKYTNRTTQIDLGDFHVNFNKVTNTITFESINFDNLLDDVLREIPFIGQFINMAESISWPSKPGPRRAIRGVSIAKLADNTLTLFYQKGASPPNLNADSTIVTEEPSFLKATPFKKITLDPVISSETHTQTVHTVDMELL